MEHKNRKTGKIMGISLLSVVLLVILDQFTKYMAVAHLKGREPFVLIDGVFQLRYLENQSAAFSFDPVSLVHRLFHIAYFDANPAAFLACFPYALTCDITSCLTSFSNSRASS